MKKRIPYLEEQIKTVCIDAGHVSGANRSPCVWGYSEGTQMWALSFMLRAALEQMFDNVDVVFTRTSPDERLRENGEDVYERGLKARGADLFISLHSDASNNVTCDGVNAVTVIYPYDGRNDSTKWADLLGATVDAALRPHANTSKYRLTQRQGRRGEYYGVLRGAMDAGVPLYFIVEHGFHTNAENATALCDPAVLSDIASAEALAIGAILDLDRAVYLPGDVNGDGKINATDYAMLKRYLIGTYKLTSEQLARADVNGDGKVNTVDYAMIKRKVIGSLK